MLLHICTDYIWNELYYELISRLQANIDNIVYVPINVNKNFKDKDRHEQYTVIKSYIYNQTDRLFFRKKEKKIFKDINEKLDFAEINMIHAHTLFSAGYIAYKLKQKYNIEYIVAVRNTDVNTFFKYRKTLRKIGIKILQNASKIIFISENHKNTMFEKYIPKKITQELLNKTEVIYNGINKFWLDNKNQNVKNLEDKKLKLIQVGRLNKTKNCKTTIKVCKQLKKRGYDVVLNIVGQGKEEKNLKKMVKNDDYIIFNGQLEKEKLVELERKSDIFILPSKYETFGLVYAEALTQKLPVIYTRNQGFDGIFPEGKIGYSVRYNSVKEIIEKIEKIIKNYSEIVENTENVSEIFDWDLIAEKYKRIYAEIDNNIIRKGK